MRVLMRYHNIACGFLCVRSSKVVGGGQYWGKLGIKSTKQEGEQSPAIGLERFEDLLLSIWSEVGFHKWS